MDGPRCSHPSCALPGDPDRAIPGDSWCAEHGAMKLEERIAVWQQRVLAQEEMERAAH